MTADVLRTLPYNQIPNNGSESRHMPKTLPYFRRDVLNNLCTRRRRDVRGWRRRYLSSSIADFAPSELANHRINNHFQLMTIVRVHVVRRLVVQGAPTDCTCAERARDGGLDKRETGSDQQAKMWRKPNRCWLRLCAPYHLRSYVP